jgi:hypothetical protein
MSILTPYALHSPAPIAPHYDVTAAPRRALSHLPSFFIQTER